MSSPWKPEPGEVAEKVIKRVELGKMARKLQNRLALAQFKTERGWEDLPLDRIEPKVQEELSRRRPLSSGDILSDSSSSSATSDFRYANNRTLLSSPLKAAAIFSSGSSNGHRKRTYHNSLENLTSSTGSRKRFRSSPAVRALGSGHTSWTNHRQLAQSSPIKPRKQPHFTTSAGPDLPFFRGAAHMQENNFAAVSDDEEDALPTHSFNIHSSPPRTPPPARNRGSLGRSGKERNGKSGEEGADLLLFLATSPSPANPASRARMQPPSTPPPKNMALPSSMMTTPGGGSGLLSVFGAPHTPSQNFDFSDFVNITPSPGQRPWPKTPGTIKTPQTVSRRHLNFDNFLQPSASPGLRDHSAAKHASLGMQLGGDLIS
ncbi:hypothetical protein OIDMADRAFT_197971 [Oidiodendron maius Zn]|uniref:Cyclin-dependent kinase n=1 Tax=Oidiodendron maius (strain Zn) TaxID=913774 RepID=A0A0C3HCM8_OIDMZ|nr:hypothetical protein OIDMADRAFT_197971 [Oidiodendron maius Zn]